MRAGDPCTHGLAYVSLCETCRNRPCVFQNKTWGDEGWWVGWGPLGEREHRRFDLEGDADAWAEACESA